MNISVPGAKGRHVIYIYLYNCWIGALSGSSSFLARCEKQSTEWFKTKYLYSQHSGEESARLNNGKLGCHPFQTMGKLVKKIVPKPIDRGIYGAANSAQR